MPSSGCGASAADGDMVIYLDRGVAVSTRWARAGTILAAAAIGLFFASLFYSQWDTYLRFHWAGTFGQTDPIFERDIGFYLFRLPFYELVRSALTGLTVITLAAVALTYGYFKVFQPRQVKTTPTDRMVTGHLALLLLFVVAAWGWGYYLIASTFSIPRGAWFTASGIRPITSNASACGSCCLPPSFWCFYRCVFFETPPLPDVGRAGSYFILYFLVLILIPGVVQKFKVEPSELELETPT